jgi:lipopolysaccharide/colanic/teichoic acid biosynthesis glycosyltransferase
LAGFNLLVSCHALERSVRTSTSPRSGAAAGYFLGGTTSEHGLTLTKVGGVPKIPSSSPSYRWRAAAKRLFDIAFATTALAALAPLLIGLAIAIRWSGPGPVLFRQWRVGRNGMPFQILKFRTMHHGLADETGLLQTEPNDPRVTRLGAFMRQKSLDELPQLINVLRGEMSVVGPRPHAAGMLAGGVPYEALVPYYHLRAVVRPGITGWAQANGLRGPTTDARAARARVDHDIAYIQNQSPLLDLRIIALTIKQEFLTGSGL